MRRARVPPAVLAVLLAASGPTYADPPDPGTLLGQAADAAGATIELVLGQAKVDIARCRSTLKAAQVDNPASSIKAYKVKVPILEIVAVDHTSIDETIYYDETDSVSAKVPDYCPAGVKTVLTIEDVAPLLSAYPSPPIRDPQRGRSASSSHTLRVPYFGARGNRVVALVTVHAEVWNTTIGNYFCQDIHYQVVAGPEGPVLQRQDESLHSLTGDQNCVGNG